MWERTGAVGADPVPLSEVLAQRSDAEDHVKWLAIDDDTAVPGHIHAIRDVVVLVSNVAFERSQV